MSKVVILCLCICFLATVICQVPRPCQTPPAWEGNASSYDHGKGIHNFWRISYDQANRRKRIVDEIRVGTPERTYHDLIMLYNTDPPVFYDINLITRECRKFSPFFPWLPYEIPENAHFIGEFTLGGKLLVTEWSDAVPGIRPETWLGQFTVDGCIPVHEVIANGNISQSVTTTFYDIIGGIANYNVFIPPSECEEAEMEV